MRSSFRRYWVAAGVVITTIGAGAGAAAQPAMSPTELLLVALMPELERAAPPRWVTAGTRVTYLTGAASPEKASLPPDEDDLSIRCTFDPAAPGWHPVSAGVGLIQLTVLRARPDQVLIEVRRYLIERGDGPVLLIGVSGRRVLPGTGGGYWADPQQLQRIPEQDENGITIVRMPHTIGTKTYDALRIRAIREETAWGYVFSARSGLLLSENSGQKATPAVRRTGAGPWLPCQGSPVVTQCDLRQIRRFRIPWGDSRLPRPLRNARRLLYTGTQTIRVYDTEVVQPAQAVMTILEQGEDWLCYSVATEIRTAQGPPLRTEVRRAGVSGMLGGLWINPDRIGECRPGQRLDEDPVTGFVTVVSSVGPLPDGREGVVISEQGKTQRIDYAYDRKTGLLMHQTVTQQIGPAQHVTAVNLAKVE